jgi:hypothetical protein
MPHPEKPLAIVVGFIGKLPVAGMALYNIHYLVGLRELGYDIHYVERLNRPDECYNPHTDAMGDDSAVAIGWLKECLSIEPLRDIRWSFIDRAGVFSGAGRETLVKDIRRADFVMTLADPTWFDELKECPRRAFVDGDPLFTQVAMLDPQSEMSDVVAMYPTLFTYCTRFGAPDCTVPTAGCEWIATRPVVSTSLWSAAPADKAGPITTVMNWAAWGEVELDGRFYGQKNREITQLIDLPSRSDREFVLALGGPSPKATLIERGWKLVNPLEVTGTIDAYRSFISGSRADLGIAKHAYVASRSGWFSDRSTCYLASGRPVLHQDTGFTDWLPVGEGVLAFSDMESLLAALDLLDSDYAGHARAARAIAEEHFEARAVIGRMLDDAGFR